MSSGRCLKHYVMDDRLRRICYARCYAFLTKINVARHQDSHITAPLCRYILGIPHSLPIRHVLLGERPYGTRILPHVASAMSFDPGLTNSTPSVHYIARDIDNHTDIDYATAHDWFRDSWKYLKQGVLVLNVCAYTSFMDPLSDRERVATEELIRDLVRVSVIMSGQRVHICGMGNPAQHSVGRIRSSIPQPKLHVTVHKAKNPAWPSHKRSDQRSPDITLGGKSVVKYFHSIVSETVAAKSWYTTTDYDKMSTGADDVVGPVVNQSRKLVDRFDEIEAAFKASPDGKSIDNGERIFRQAKEEMTQFILVMQSMKTRMMFMNVSEPAGVAKQTYMNSRQQYRPQENTFGRSSRVSSATSNTPRSVKKLTFADADADSDSDAGVKPESTSTSGPGKTTAIDDLSPTPGAHVRKPKASSTYSAMSRRSTSIGFVVEESEDDSSNGLAESKVNSANADGTAPSPSSDIASDDGETTAMTNDEAKDMEYVAAFLEEDEEYGLDPMLVNTFREAIKSSRAQSPRAKEVLKVIRGIRSNPGAKAVKLALGFITNEVDMPSPIVQWLLKNAVST